MKKWVNNGWYDINILENLGVYIEEVFRFKYFSGLQEAFRNSEFNKSWIYLLGTKSGNFI